MLHPYEKILDSAMEFDRFKKRFEKSDHLASTLAFISRRTELRASSVLHFC